MSPEKHGGWSCFFCLQIKTKVFYKVIVQLVSYQVFPSTQNNKFAISLKHLKENGKNEVDFLLADKNQKFVQIDTAILDVCGQECPQYRNILIKKVCDEVDFLYADKHESYLQIDGLISAGDGQTFPKFPK